MGLSKVGGVIFPLPPPAPKGMFSPLPPPPPPPPPQKKKTAVVKTP